MEALTEQVLISLITTVGAIILALLGLLPQFKKVTNDIQATKKAAEKTEQSINNRDSSASDRWDVMHSDILATQRTQSEIREEVAAIREDHQETRRELKVLHREDRAARTEAQETRVELREHAEETRKLRRDFDQHCTNTAPMITLLEDLHERVTQEPTTK